MIFLLRKSKILSLRDSKILSLRNGRAEMFGPKKQVLAALFPRVGQPHKPQAMPNAGHTQAPQITAQATPVPQQVQQAQVPAHAPQAGQPMQTAAPTQQVVQAQVPAQKTLELTATG